MNEQGQEPALEVIPAGERSYVIAIDETLPEKRLIIRERLRSGDGIVRENTVVVSKSFFFDFLDGLHDVSIRAGFLQRKEIEVIAPELTTGSQKKNPSGVVIRTLEATRRDYPMAYAPWTAEDDERLKNAYRTCTEIKALAKTFQRQPGAIRSRLARLGLLPPR